MLNEPLPPYKTYPEGFNDWSLEEKNKYFSEASKSYLAEKNKQTDHSSSIWPEIRIIVSNLAPVAPFSSELLPKSLSDYVTDVSDRQQSPPDFVAVAALCGLSSLIGNKISIRPKQNDDWLIVPNLWGTLIGAPSTMKSPALKSALFPIYSLESELREGWQREKIEADIDSKLSEIEDAANLSAVKNALKAGDREKARRLFAEKIEKEQKNIVCPRLSVNDVTVEKLGELLNENSRGLLLIRDELSGFFSRMEREEFLQERSFYLEAFNGDGKFSYDRIGRGTIHIEPTTLSIVGCIQPSRVAPLIRGSLNGSSDDGLIQRFQVVTWPDIPKNWQWRDRKPDEKARNKYQSIFSSFHEMTFRISKPQTVPLSAEGYELFKSWTSELHTLARSQDLSYVFESYLLKLPKTVCAIALILHLAEGGVGPISGEAVGRALDWSDYLQSHAKRLYSSISLAADQNALFILKRRKHLSQFFSARDIKRKNWTGLTHDKAVDEALEVLVTHNYCRQTKTVPSSAGGRPTFIFEWHPKLITES